MIAGHEHRPLWRELAEQLEQPRVEVVNVPAIALGRDAVNVSLVIGHDEMHDR